MISSPQARLAMFAVRFIDRVESVIAAEPSDYMLPMGFAAGSRCIICSIIICIMSMRFSIPY